MDGQVVFAKMDANFLFKLDTLRAMCGFPFQITSSWRSPEKNKAVGGAVNSMHLQGRAVDIFCDSNVRRFTIIRAATQMGLTVGIMPNAIHIDDRTTPIVFHYYSRFRPIRSNEE